MKNIAGLLSLAACAPALAQTHMMMPEGSKDIYLSLGVASSPAYEGSARRETFVAPLISVQWANGVFIDMNVIGMHLSEDPGMAYGPLFSPGTTRVDNLAQAQSDKRARSRFTPEVGGFFHYTLSHGLGVRSQLMYGGSADRRGVRVALMPYLEYPVGEHHSLGLQGRLQLANRSALQARFAVPGQHEVSAGLRDASVGIRWRWELNTKYTLSTSVSWTKLLGSAGASPRVERAAGTTAVTILTYHY